MKRSAQIICTAIFVMIFSAVSIAAERMDIKEAFKKGIISITAIALARGEMIELRLKRQPEKPVIIVISPGRTDLGEIAVLSDREKEVDLSSKIEESVTLKQTGANKMTHGQEELSAE